jgi:hypothetical protein
MSTATAQVDAGMDSWSRHSMNPSTSTAHGLSHMSQFLGEHCASHLVFPLGMPTECKGCIAMTSFDPVRKLLRCGSKMTEQMHAKWCQGHTVIRPSRLDALDPSGRPRSGQTQYPTRIAGIRQLLDEITGSSPSAVE